MRYLLIMYGGDDDWTQWSESEVAPALAAHESFENDLRKVNAYVAGEAIQPSAATTTIRIKDRKPLITDGPYIESKEQIGGFYLIDVEDLDQALEWATRLAEFDGGPIEVRPAIDVQEHNGVG